MPRPLAPPGQHPGENLPSFPSVLCSIVLFILHHEDCSDGGEHEEQHEDAALVHIAEEELTGHLCCLVYGLLASGKAFAAPVGASRLLANERLRILQRGDETAGACAGALATKSSA